MKRAPGLPSGKLGMGLAVVNMGDDGKLRIWDCSNICVPPVGKSTLTRQAARNKRLRSKTLPQAEFISAEGH